MSVDRTEEEEGPRLQPFKRGTWALHCWKCGADNPVNDHIALRGLKRGWLVCSTCRRSLSVDSINLKIREASNR